MSGAAREKDEADYDLERFVEMFDQAMTSSDPRVKNALRQLMMMVILTDTSSDHEAGMRASHGPLRRLQEDMREQFKWIRRLEQEIENLKRQMTSTHGLGGYRSEGWPNIKYADNTGQAIPGALSSTDYWNQVVAQTNAQKIPEYVQDLNIKVNGGLLPKEQK